MKLKKITIFELDTAKSRLLMFRAGYRYMPSTSGPTEHRGLLEDTGTRSSGACYLPIGTASISGRSTENSPGDTATASQPNEPSRYVLITSHPISERSLLRRQFSQMEQDGRNGRLYLSFPQTIRTRAVLRTSERHGDFPNRQVNALGFVFSMYF